MFLCVCVCVFVLTLKLGDESHYHLRAGHGASWLLASHGTKSYSESQCHQGSCGNCPGNLRLFFGVRAKH